MPTIADGELARLLSWLSPAFPVGAYSYSHGIEYAVEAGIVVDATGLRTWIEGILRHGSGRVDAILFGEAWRAEREGDDKRLGEVLAWGEVFRGTAELALESSAQGRAFLDAVRAGWPHPRVDGLLRLATDAERTLAYPVAVGVACAVVGIGEALARLAYLQAFAANLVSAGVRLIPLGQSDGLRALAALEHTVRDVAEQSAGLRLADLGTATWMADWASARHETQYTRLFRS
jgi:urease accessory protein